MEKGELTAQLRAVGCTDGAGVYWGDEMRLGLMGQVRRVWAPRGVKVEQMVEHRREWAYLNLGVNGLTGQLVWDWTDNLKGESIASVVRQWAPKGVAVIVWDQARGHRGEAYKGVPVQLVAQPPYSPQLNPAERVFEHVRGRIEGKVYGTLAAKKAAVEAELEGLAAAPEQVKRLAGWDWIQQSVANLSLPNMAVN